MAARALLAAAAAAGAAGAASAPAPARPNSLLAAAAGAGTAAAGAASAPARPNFVFLHCESTDGRLFRPGSPAPIPNIRGLQARGVTFDANYANAPVCCPSRSSMLSGRYPHKVRGRMGGGEE
jgi:N-acetylglucosamine-6-sulfatase